MSDQEKSGHNVGEASSVVMVDKGPSSGSRHRPFRPTELQDEQADQPHIRSTAPAVPKVVEELKDNPATTAQDDTLVKERKDINKKSSEGHKRQSKKSKRRISDSTENMELDTFQAEPVREKPALPSQPIPVDVMSITSAVSEPIPKAVGKLLDEDELAALSPKTAQKTSEWRDSGDVALAQQENETEGVTNTKIEVRASTPTTSRQLPKKGISWNDSQHIEKVPLRMLDTESQLLTLERKASVGPCFRPGMPCGGPSGITICLPRKSNKNLTEEKPLKSGICISISKKSLPSKSKCEINTENNKIEPKPKEETIEQLPIHCLSELRVKFGTMCVKVRNAFKM